MAIIDPVVTQLDVKTVVVLWEAVTNDDTGAPVGLSQYPDKTVQVIGTFGTTGICTMQGSPLAAPTSNDWGVLKDALGADVAPGDQEPALIAESTRVFRPSVAGGDATTDLDVYVTCVAR